MVLTWLMTVNVYSRRAPACDHGTYIDLWGPLAGNEKIWLKVPRFARWRTNSDIKGARATQLMSLSKSLQRDWSILQFMTQKRTREGNWQLYRSSGRGPLRNEKWISVLTKDRGFPELSLTRTVRRAASPHDTGFVRFGLYQENWHGLLNDIPIPDKVLHWIDP